LSVNSSGPSNARYAEKVLQVDGNKRNRGTVVNRSGISRFQPRFSKRMTNP
jgi:hypothetical protein